MWGVYSEGLRVWSELTGFGDARGMLGRLVAVARYGLSSGRRAKFPVFKLFW